MSTLKEIIKETEHSLKRSRQRRRVEEEKLKEKGWTEVAIRQHRGWHRLSLNSIKASAYEKIVKIHKSEVKTQ